MVKMYTHEDVENMLLKYGVKLKSKYVKNDEKLNMICSCGNSFSKSLKTMKRRGNFKCNKCIVSKQSNKNKLEYKTVAGNIKGMGYDLLSKKYEGNKIPLKMKCKKGHIFNMSYNNLMNNHGCPWCSDNHRFSYEEVKEEINNLGFILLDDEYKNTNNPLKIKCNKNHIFHRSFSNIRRNSKCPYCEGKPKYTIEDIRKHISKLNLVLLSSKYVPKEKLKLMCEEGHIFYRTWSNLKKSEECPICNGQNKKTYEFIVSEFDKKGYKVLSEKEDYKNTKTKLNVLCPNNNLWITTYNIFKNGHGCGCVKCANNQVLSYKYVKEYIEKDGNKLLSKEYINNSTPLNIKCSCGYIYYPNFNNYKNGSRCPKCRLKIYKGEKSISEWLDYNGIDYIPQKQFKGLIGLGGGNLSYDFYLPKYNLLIEYQGKQHQKYTEGLHGSHDDYLKQLEHDRRKKEYTKKHNINLLEIWYYEFDEIEEILNRELIKNIL